MIVWGGDGEPGNNPLATGSRFRLGLEGAICVDATGCASGNCSNGICAPAGFAHIPAGSFCMGSPGGGGSAACPDGPAEPGRLIREGPLHEVIMTRPFLLGETETTQAEWQAVMGSNPSYFDGDPGPARGGDSPVEIHAKER